MKKLLSLLLVMTMIVSMMSSVALAEEVAITESKISVFEDMPNDWSTTALEHAVDNGLLSGYNGKILPSNNLTRAEMATVINRAFGTTDEADLSEFTDVSEDAWYYSNMAKAVAMETFQGNGNGKLNPESDITREEAFVVLANAFKLSSEDTSSLDSFTDKEMVSSWAISQVAALVDAGYVAGSDGKLNPTAYITRAEFATLMDNILKNYITTAGTYEEDLEGNVMINVADVTLENITITGDLIIGDGVGDGDVTLDSVTVTGRTVIRGGGVNSIKITGDSTFSTIIIARVKGELRVYNEDGVEIGEVIVDGNDDVIIEGYVGSVEILAGDVTVTATNAQISTVTVEGENAEIVANEGASVETVVVNADGAEVSGDGDVGAVEANANDVNVSTEGTQVEASEGTTGVTAGEISVEPGTTETVGTTTTVIVSTSSSSNDDDDDDDDSSSSSDSSSNSSSNSNSSSSNNAPTVVSGQEIQSGIATAPSTDGSVTPVAFTADMSTWFEDDDNDTLTYSVVSATNNSSSVKDTVAISGASINYTPEFAHGGYETVIKVKANDGEDNSTSNVTITVTVNTVMEPQGTKVKLDNGTWVVDNTNGTHIGIWAVEDLQEIGTTSNGIFDTDNDGSNLNEAYVLMADIDFTEEACYRDATTNQGTYVPDSASNPSNSGFEPIGDGSSMEPFSGSLNGNGYKISNLYINRSSEDYIGLFGYADSAMIENLGIVSCDITGNKYVGGLVAQNSGSTLSAIYVTGDVTGKDNEVGGAIGFNNYGTIIDSYTIVNVEGSGDEVGGLVGNNDSSTIKTSYVAGNVTGGSFYVGGLVGHNVSSQLIACYATADVTGNGQIVGGLVGLNYLSQVTACYATGDVIGSGDCIGGLVGYNNSSTIANSIAMSSSIIGINEVNRVVGSYDSLTSVNNNYAFIYMTSNGSTTTLGATDNALGGNLTLTEFAAENTYDNDDSDNTPALDWDITVWEMKTGADRPTLIGVGTDDGLMTNNAPVVVDGEEKQTGEATVFASGEVITYTADLSSWFIDYEEEALTYGAITATNDNGDVSQTVSIQGSTLTYTPIAAHVGYDTEIIVKANDGQADSTSTVAITVSVTNMYAQGTKMKLEGDTWVVDDTNGTHIGIWSVEDLQAIGITSDGIFDTNDASGSLDEDYVLMADIDFEDADCYRDANANKATYIPNDTTTPTNEGFEPIGNSSNKFEGTFNGNDHTISNLYINRSAEDFIGLFGYISSATIENVGINSCDITGNNTVGGLSGYNLSSTLAAVYVSGEVSCKDQYAGGLSGIMASSIITSSYATATVEVIGTDEDSYAGGLVGWTWGSSTIIQSYATGAVTGTNKNIGGLVGSNGGTVIECYATGNVESTNSGSFLGGLVGKNSSSATIENCIAFNSMITENDESGKITGGADAYNAGTLTNNYANGSMTGASSGTTSDKNGADLTAAEFAAETTYDGDNTDSTPALNWDFTDVWEIKNDGERPTLLDVGTDDGSYNIAPIVVSGKETQTGEAMATSSNEVQVYTADMSGWFTDSDGDDLSYILVSVTNNGSSVTSTVDITGNTITYTPTATHTGNDTTIVVKANDGETDSTSNVTITVSVTNMYAQGTKVKLDNDTWVVDNTDGTHIGIWSVEDLQAMGVTQGGIYDTDADGSNLDEAYVLMADIDFESDESYRDSDTNKATYIPDTNSTNKGFDPIGDATDKFKGSFNGNEHVVSNLYINRATSSGSSDTSGYYIGLFGVASSAVIENVGIDECNITGYTYVGGLAGTVGGSSTISGIYVNGNVSATYHVVGGLVGNAGYAEITESYATVTVTGDYNNVGGLTGRDYGAKISECYATGEVNGVGINVGGLVGVTESSTEITKCYATGDVNGENNSVGGLVGCNDDSSKISECYATGDVTSTTNSGYVGGLVGKNNSSSTIENSIAINSSITVANATGGRITGYNGNDSILTNNYAYKNMTVNGSTVSGGTSSNEDGADLTSDEFIAATTYDTDSTDGTPALDWDFTDVWVMGTDQPKLQAVTE